MFQILVCQWSGQGLNHSRWHRNLINENEERFCIECNVSLALRMCCWYWLFVERVEILSELWETFWELLDVDYVEFVAKFMLNFEIQGVDFYAINTDAQALLNSAAENPLQIGELLTRGLGLARVSFALDFSRLGMRAFINDRE